ncbi:penicillin-binding protein activator [Rosenbergiella epipactidis]|uniref:penicillin-binding protein activator n=1 Tax=Rosenbergiella epipactidis TaxID=1544694 RepID=UPI001F4DBB47|nr:penicillin-binding protein activator [Rosenbergiella epipactidis]
MLSSFVNRRNAGRFVPVVLAGFILAACGVNQENQTPSATLQPTANQGSAYYLQQMQQSQDDSRSHWQLLAIRALLDEGKVAQAGQQLQQLPSQLTAEQQVERHFLAAQYAIKQQQFREAAKQLSALSVPALNDTQRQRYYQLMIDSAQGEAPIDVLRAYIALQPHLAGSAQQKNLDATWQTLVTIPQDQVGNITINANENILQGWLDLLGVYYQNRGDQDNLKHAVQDWQTRYPDNPASKTLPAGLAQVMNLSVASTNTIALLLPLTGPGAVFSKAIEQGFEDARNGHLASSAAATPDANTIIRAPQTTASATSDAAVSPSAVATPAADTSSATADASNQTAAVPGTASANTAAQIKVYDTNGHPIDQLLQQAQQEGATLVVGPLLKEDVAKAVTTQTSLNILALNEPSDLQNHPNVCYFALSPENEARDAAEHMWAQGKRSPVLLLPSNSLGDRVATAFTRQWQSLGGGTVLRQAIGSESDLRSKINSNAGIALSGTPVTAAPSSDSGAVTVAGMTFDAPSAQPVAESGSVDSVYIVANQASLDLIKPLITMKIGSQSHVAFYANSLSSQAGAGPDFRFEMEGLQFSDIPLLSGANPSLKQQVTGQFNQDYTLTRLYAMGVDAWTLANHFTPLRQQPGYQLQGNTGLLKATQNCVINRTLSWNQYTHGEIVPVK